MICVESWYICANCAGQFSLRLWDISYVGRRHNILWVLGYSSNVQGRIIHEAVEAEASGPGPRISWYNENLQSRTTLGPKFLEKKFAVF